MANPILDEITLTDTVQTWAICSLCNEPYRDEPGGGLSVPDDCEVCGNSLGDEEREVGFWFSHEDESELHGPFDTLDAAEGEALAYVLG